MTLMEVEIGKEYAVQDIAIDDWALKGFLFSLGCYGGEPITVISRRRKSCTVAIKDGRYCIDYVLANAISVKLSTT